MSDCSVNEPGHCPHFKAMGFCCHCQEGLEPDEIQGAQPRPAPASTVSFQAIRPDTRCLRCGGAFPPSASVERSDFGLIHHEPPCQEAPPA